jgi:hypothetical protein
MTMQRIRPTNAFLGKLTPEQQKFMKRVRVAEAKRLLAQLERLPKLGE